MNECQAGHGSHELREAVMSYPQRGVKMFVYAADEYDNTLGYCTGDDVVSRSLIATGCWERWNTKLLLKNQVFKKNHVIDIGSHIGWYTLLGASFGCSATAVEGDPENASTLRKNIELNDFKNVEVYEEWVQEGWDFQHPVEGDIDLIKIDLEGNDGFAVEGVWPFVEQGRVNNLFVEVSPVFREGYPELVQRICEAGYAAIVSDPEPFELPSYEWVAEQHQVDVLFRKL